MALAKASTTAIGKAFERHTVKFLNHHLNMCVREVGGAGDGGIDIRGWWFVPAHARQGGGVNTDPKQRQMLDEQAQRDWEQELREIRAGVPGWGKLVDELGSEEIREDGQTGEDTDSGEEDMLDRLAGDMGAWTRLRVIGQCKAEKKAVGARVVRELDGVISQIQGGSSLSFHDTLSPIDGASG